MKLYEDLVLFKKKKNFKKLDLSQISTLKFKKEVKFLNSFKTISINNNNNNNNNNNYYYYYYLTSNNNYQKRNDMSTIFLQQIISGRLLLVVIIEAKK